MLYNQHDLIKIITNVLKCEENEINNKSGLSKTLNWDSLNHVVILTTIEDYFGIKIEDDNFASLLTLQDIIEFLDNYQLKICIDSGECNCEDLCYTEERVVFNSSDGIQLVGIYCYSKIEPKGFVLLTHGIPSEKDEGGFHKNMAAYFAKGGYDSFRFDFRYMGESEAGSESNLSLQNLMCDIESAYKISSIRRNIMHCKRFAVGTSCGGGILLKWINEYNHKNEIDKVLLCCPVLDYVYECTHKTQDEIINEKDKIYDLIQRVGYVDLEGIDAKYGLSFFNDALQFDAQSELLKYGKRISIYHGTKDPSVPFEFAESFANKNKLADLIVVDWARHGFGVPFLDKQGKRIPDDIRYKMKMKHQSDVINSIFCSMKGELQ